MWIGELITKRGVGNGISLLIFASILATAPPGITAWVNGGSIEKLFFPLVAIGIVVAVVFIQEGQRRIPIQYAKRMVGRRMTAGGSTYMPLRVNMAGVIPVIFAAALMAFPPTIAQFFPQTQGFDQPPLPAARACPYLLLEARADHHLHVLLHGGPVQPGRPGRQPAQARRLHPRDQARPADGALPRPRADAADAARLALPGDHRGAPSIFINYFGFSQATSRALGGTSVLIVVGVALDTMRQMESQMMMRSYEGFLK